MAGSLRCVPLAALVLVGSAIDVGPLPKPPAGYQFAYASPDCAPWDGAAMSIYLGASPVFSTAVSAVWRIMVLKSWVNGSFVC